MSNEGTPPPLTPEEEARMQQEIERAIEPYRHIAPPKLLATMRETLEHTLRTHPYPRQLIQVMVAPKAVEASSEVPRGNASENDSATGQKPSE